MLDEVQPDAAFILVSHGQSKGVILDCLRRGIPCLCEKPAGQTPEEARELADAAEAANVLAAVGLNRRFYSTINTALEKIRKKGPVLGITVEFAQPIRGLRNQGRFSQDELDHWQLFNGIHAIDLFRHVCGEVKEVNALRRSLEEPNGDNFAATLAFNSRAIGTYQSHWVSGQGRHMSAKIFGNSIHAELPNLETCFLKTETSRIPVPLEPSPEDIVFKPGLYQQTLSFLDAVAGNAQTLPVPLVSLRDAVGTMDLVEQLAFNAPLRTFKKSPNNEDL